MVQSLKDNYVSDVRVAEITKTEADLKREIALCRDNAKDDAIVEQESTKRIVVAERDTAGRIAIATYEVSVSRSSTSTLEDEITRLKHTAGADIKAIARLEATALTASATCLKIENSNLRERSTLLMDASVMVAMGIVDILLAN
ncbi:hypothetical protein V493_06149 [Pseudogymnoascus sp. VKM F-4281 (FW-2241)]|nr:hypothetical protein V493_06149 [Pseudogymnoascus sp. VKM F-4281 (FW-2241)]